MEGSALQRTMNLKNKFDKFFLNIKLWMLSGVNIDTRPFLIFYNTTCEQD